MAGIPINLSGGWAEMLQAMIQAGEFTAFTAFNEECTIAAEYALTLYRSYLNGSTLPNGTKIQHPTGKLADAARLDERAYLDFHLMNDLPYAEAVEKGTKERDMKEMLPTARKARRSKEDGSLYLVIPFRHSVPGATATGMKPMPERVYQMAKNLDRSSIKSRFKQLAVTPEIGPKERVWRRRYQWGGKLNVSDLEGQGLSYQQINRFQGMYKFGKIGHTQYITFRVMSQKSKGWILPARPGIFAAKAAMEESNRERGPMIDEALVEDILNLMG